MEPAFGVSVTIPLPQIVEMAAATSGITADASPANGRPGNVLHVLERGVMGVQAPRVAGAADAWAVV